MNWRGASAMPTHSIDYLNARRAAIQAGHARPQPRADRVLNVAARKLRDAEMDLDQLDMLHEQVRLVFAEFRSWFAESTNQLVAGDIAGDEPSIPF